MRGFLERLAVESRAPAYLLVDRAGTVVDSGGRIVKTIGDEVMFITEEPAAAATIALRLARASNQDAVLPDARAGLASGPVLSREGDYYGQVVNLASRLTELAFPGTVLASSDLATELEGRPEADNLVGIYAALADKSKAEVLAEFGGGQFSTFKKALAELAVSRIARPGCRSGFD